MFILFLLYASAYAAPEPANKIEQLAVVMNYLKRTYIEQLDDNTIAEKAIRGLLNQLDPHSDYLDQKTYKSFKEDSDGGFVGIGMEVTLDRGLLRVISPIDGSPALEAGLQSGDIITHIDEKLVTDIGYEEAIRLIKGKRGTTVKLTVVREDVKTPIIMKIKRDVISVSRVKEKMLTSDIGYLRITTFSEGVDTAVENAVKKLQSSNTEKLKGLVLDLRNNPGGLLETSIDVTSLFLDSSTLPSPKTIVTAEDRTFKSKRNYQAHGTDIVAGIPIIVLINHGSASGSEILALALQDYERAIIMGEQSFGKGSIQTIIPIDKTSAMKITTGLYYSPKGRLIQGHGVTPDVEIPSMSVNHETKAFRITESDYPRALHNPQVQQTKPKLTAQYQDFLENLQVLHDSDFQVYQAVLLLESLRQFNS